MIMQEATTSTTKRKCETEETISKKRKLEPLQYLCPDIMENIFRFLSPKDLLQARLVCKEWNETIKTPSVSLPNDEISCLYADTEKITKVFPRSIIKPLFCKKNEIVTSDGDDAVEFTLTYEDGTYYESSTHPTVSRYYHDPAGILVFIEEVYYVNDKIEKIVDRSYDGVNNGRVRVFNFI